MNRPMRPSRRSIPTECMRSAFWEACYAQTMLDRVFDEVSVTNGPQFSEGFYKRVKKFTLRSEEFEKTTTKKIKRHLYTGAGLAGD